MDLKKINLAKITHDAFHLALPHVEDKPVFEDLPDSIKNAWMAGAIFAILAVMEDVVPKVAFQQYYTDQEQADADTDAADLQDMSSSDGCQK